MKKFLLILIPYSLFLTPIFSQGTWSPIASLPDTSRFQGIVGFNIGNFGYVGLGEDAAFKDLKTFWQYNPSNNTWTKKADFPGSARVAPASFVIGKYAYIVTGSIHNAGACVNECWQYNSVKDTWSQKANFPGGARVYAVGFAIGNKGYVGTGADELKDFYKDFYVYDTATNSWTRIADFGGEARDGDCGFSVNGKGYVCFGQDSTTTKYYKDIWVYDTNIKTWTQKSNYPGSPTQASNGFVIGNSIYVGSGYDSSVGYNKLIWQYNTILDSWNQQTSPPGYSKIQGAAFAIGDTGYYGLGIDSAGNTYSTFYKFLPDTTTGINKVAKKNNFNIYPNPSNGVFTIKWSGVCYQSSIDIYNMLGEKINSQSLTLNAQFSIDLSNQPNGVYLYRVLSKDDAQLSTGKLIIEK